MASLGRQVPFPGCEALAAAARRYAAVRPGADYYGDLTRAHRAAGLLHEHAVGDRRCTACSSQPSESHASLLNRTQAARTHRFVVRSRKPCLSAPGCFLEGPRRGQDRGSAVLCQAAHHGRFDGAQLTV